MERRGSRRLRNLSASAVVVLLAVGCGRGGPLSTGSGGAGGAVRGGSGGALGDAGGDAGLDGTSAEAPSRFVGWRTCGDLTSDRPPRPPYALAASPDGRWLALLDMPMSSMPGRTNPQSVALWNLPSTVMVLRIEKIDAGSLAADVDLSPDGSLVAITGDASIMVRTATGERIWEHPPPPDADLYGWVRNFAFTPDGAVLASGRSRQVDLFRASDGVLIKPFAVSTPCLGVAISPDGSLLATSAPSLLRLGDLVSLWSRPIFSPDWAGILLTDHWVTFSPDGALLVAQYARIDTAARGLTFETTTQLFETASGALVRDLGEGLARRPTFSPDGRWIVAGERLFNLQTRQTATLPIPAAASVFLPDGRIFVAESTGATHLLCPL